MSIFSRNGGELARFGPLSLSPGGVLVLLAGLLFGGLSLPAATVLPASAPAMQQSFTGDGVKVTVSIPAESIARFGYVPVRISIDNALPRELRWQAIFTSNVQSNLGAMAMQTREFITVPVARNAEHWVYIPSAEAGSFGPMGFFGGNFTVTIDGPAISETTLRFASSGPRESMSPWAVSASLESAVRTHISLLKATPGMRGRVPPAVLRRAPGAGTGPRPMITGAPNLGVFDPASPLGDWRMWTPFGRVLMRDDEYATLAPANRTALRNWVALGGWLYLSPETSRPGITQRLGAGAIVALGDPIAAHDGQDSEGLFSPTGIFGSTPAIPRSSDLAMQKTSLSEKIAPPRRAGDWLVYFFIGFAVLVAPVNLFVFAPARRRHRLFVTMPVIAAVAVGFLFSVIFLQDGVGGEGARRALVVLLPGENQAAVFQDQVSRTGLLFNGGFALADDTICAAVAAEDGNFMPGRPLQYDRDDGRASGDWFRARARQGQHLRRLTPTRARVERVGQAPDGAPIVQSSVGATLHDFHLLDADETAWWAERVSPGTPVTLQRTRPGDSSQAERWTRFAGSSSVHFRELVQQVAQGPARDRFVARADDSDLAPLPTLAAIRWTDSEVMLTGIVQAGGKSAP